MSENPEVSYYQSIIDDLRVAHERLTEIRDQLAEETAKQRDEITMLRSIVALAATYLTDSHATNRDRLDEAVWTYFNSKTVKS